MNKFEHLKVGDVVRVLHDIESGDADWGREVGDIGWVIEIEGTWPWVMFPDRRKQCFDPDSDDALEKVEASDASE